MRRRFTGQQIRNKLLQMFNEVYIKLYQSAPTEQKRLSKRCDKIADVYQQSKEI